MGAEVLAYRLGCLIHWAPRERSIRNGLLGLSQEMRQGARLVDVGSGLGQLSRLAKELKIDYVGLEPGATLREASQRDFPSAKFLAEGADALHRLVGSNDIVVLNGVAHHLDEALLGATFHAASRARAVIVCDHLREDGRTHALARWLQDRDQGKFVRPYSTLSTMPVQALQASERFPIGPLGMPWWTYFCNVYANL